MIIAVDTGGTKTLAARFSPSGTIEASERFATPPQQADYLAQLIETVHTLAGDTDSDDLTLVVALPGIVQGGIAVWCNHLQWSDFDVRTPLSVVFPEATIFVENDANLGGVGEVRKLATIPRSALYVTISTGIGTGVIEHGTIDESLATSEGGRSLVEYAGRVREWESFAAGSAIKEAYGSYARDITDQHIWDEIADRIGRGFLAIIPFIQPDIVIIGGSMGSFFASYGPQLEAILQKNLPPHIPCPVFSPAQTPEEAVIYGGYYHALDQRTR